MIRILTADEPNAITITVDGQLLDDCVDAVERCSDQAMGQGRPVHLFSRDVSHIDEHGRSLLSRLAGKGVRLAADRLLKSMTEGLQAIMASTGRSASPAATSAGDAAR
jgi:hypothetical protein